MSKRQKRLQKIRQNPRGVTFDELRTVLEDYGFTMRLKGGTSHRFFYVAVGEWKRSVTIPYQRPHVNATYVRDALSAIDELIALTETEDEDDK